MHVWTIYSYEHTYYLIFFNNDLDGQYLDGLYINFLSLKTKIAFEKYEKKTTYF